MAHGETGRDVGPITHPACNRMPGMISARRAGPSAGEISPFNANVPPPPVNDKLLLIDGPRYGGSTTVASLEDGLAYPNPNQDFDNSTTRRQDRGPRAPLAGDHRIGSPPCSATRWAHGMRDDGGVITKYIKTWLVYWTRPTVCEGGSTNMIRQYVQHDCR